MKKSRWYLYFIPGSILFFAVFMAIAILFGADTAASNVPFEP